MIPALKIPGKQGLEVVQLILVQIQGFVVHVDGPSDENLPSDQRIISSLMLPLILPPGSVTRKFVLGVVELDIREHLVLLREREDLRKPCSLLQDLFVLRSVVVDVLGVINSKKLVKCYVCANSLCTI